MLVAIRVDQLHVHSNLVSGATHTALENVGNAKGFTYVTHVCRLVSVLHDGGARNHPEIPYL